MVMLRPFRPLRYNPAVVGDLSAVVAPPYDVISGAYTDTLYARSEYNVIRLELNRSPDRYAASAATLAAWCRSGALQRDSEPSLGYYVETFALRDGTQHKRAGILATVRLEAFDTGRIQPHERTFARAKEDRMQLLKACRTNLSPVFGLYADRQEALAPARRVAASRPADVDLHDDQGHRHRLWLLADPHDTAAIAEALADATVMIADGHHRYETALAYRDQVRAAGNDAPEAPHNFILMYLTSMSDPGLVILPTHRVLGAALSAAAGKLPDCLHEQFRVTSFAPAARNEFVAAVRQGVGRIGVALAGHEELFVAEVSHAESIDAYVAELAPAVRSLDVTVLDRVILRGLLGVNPTEAAQAGELTYTHDDGEALDAVRHGAAAAFLISPPRIEDVAAVCATGATMPEKSTYFYPKLLTGLVFHPLDP